MKLLRGRFALLLRSPDGRFRRTAGHNTVTLGGLQFLSETYVFTAVSHTATRRVGLIDTAGFTAVDKADTMLSHAGWTEFDDYNENRPALVRTLPSPLVLTDQLTFESGPFTINADGSISGAFIGFNLSTTKGDTAGTLWCASAFSAAVPVSSGDVGTLTYVATEETN